MRFKICDDEHRQCLLSVQSTIDENLLLRSRSLLEKNNSNEWLIYTFIHSFIN